MDTDQSLNNQENERRECRRIYRRFTTRFQFLRYASKSGWDVVFSQNMSAKGIVFTFDQKVELGTLIEMAIHIPLFNKPVTCVGEVRRVEQIENTNSFQIASDFIIINPEAQKQINDIAEGRDNQKAS